MLAPDSQPIRGDLQLEIMRILWGTASASVEEVRKALPAKRRGAYTTVQTVLNRLADRGLVERRKEAKAIQYSVRISEPEYVTGSLQRTLEGASEAARVSALANLVEELAPQDLDAISDIAAEIRTRRGS